ncbi:Metallo-dependent phosphatase-like protein [Chlamydoabsidia padenii]|nr:Metallo-dependent phosphatase-like protein [Chlamydoabsidia padenii]
MAGSHSFHSTEANKRKRLYWLLAGLIGLVVISVAIVVPLVVMNELNGYAVSNYANLTRIQTIEGDALVNKQRIFVFGDIHGCLDEFNKLVDQIQFNPSSDLIILAGDMIAKGPASSGVIRRAKELKALCVRGNHDDKAVRFKTYEKSHGSSGMDQPNEIMPEGNVPDPLKYKNAHLALSRDLSDDDYDYLVSCPAILHLPSLNNSVVVHGGLDPTVTDLAQQQPLNVMTMRDIDEGHPTDKKKVGSPWADIWNQAQEHSNSPVNVYYGHDASRGLVIKPFTYGLDTGCVYGRNLTTIEMKSKQTFSVPCKQYAL